MTDFITITPNPWTLGYIMGASGNPEEIPEGYSVGEVRDYRRGYREGQAAYDSLVRE